MTYKKVMDVLEAYKDAKADIMGIYENIIKAIGHIEERARQRGGEITEEEDRKHETLLRAKREIERTI